MWEFRSLPSEATWKGKCPMNWVKLRPWSFWTVPTSAELLLLTRPCISWGLSAAAHWLLIMAFSDLAHRRCKKCVVNLALMLCARQIPAWVPRWSAYAKHLCKGHTSDMFLASRLVYGKWHNLMINPFACQQAAVLGQVLGGSSVRGFVT